MTVVVFASPPVPAVVPPVLWTHDVHTWEAWDGTVWDLCAGTMGVLLLAGVRGMDMPDDITHWSAESPAVDGTYWRGCRIGPREVFWPVRLQSRESSRQWKQLRSGWWRSLSPRRTGVWRVTHPDGESRTLRCRFVSDGQQARTIAPELVGRDTYGVTLRADDPFWRGAPLRHTFGGPVTQGLFFGGDDPEDPEAVELGPPFFISEGYDTVAVSNPGDVEAWPVWRLNGPLTSATVGVGDQVVTFPHTIPDGTWVEIDTDPRSQTAVDSAGNNRTADLGSYDFAPIPDGDQVELVVSVAGGGNVDVTITPGYLRAD